MKISQPAEADRPPEFSDPLIDGSEDAAGQHRALAVLWLAESVPLTAAPTDSLTNICANLNLESSPARRRSWRIFAIAGWAAAACFAILWWRYINTAVRTPAPVESRSEMARQNPPATSSVGVSEKTETKAPDAVRPITDPEELRRELLELRATLHAANNPAPGTHRPVIQELRPPGSTAPAASHDRVLDIIATALENDLRRRTAGDARELVIESGWANWSTALPADTVFRHRQFPLDRWAELGLLQSGDGRFLDPATGWLWSPDPDSTDYTGRAAPPDLDRELFAGPDKVDGKKKESEVSPAGYLLTGAGGQTIVALSNLPVVPEGATLSMTASSANGDFARYAIAVPASAARGSWDFSGIIADSIIDTAGGFNIELQEAGGAKSTILGTLVAP